MPDRQDIVELSGRAQANALNAPAPAREVAPANSASDASDIANVKTPSAGEERTFLRLWFVCSSQYARAYKSEDGTAYTGRCPTCQKCIRFQVGEGGTSQRSFTVSCR
ncbi:MAG: hypothetical protein K2X32_02330 [Phycisphaerales bacterium]|nr:hypothetical protein [Phycisphaerales bacterium]